MAYYSWRILKSHEDETANKLYLVHWVPIISIFALYILYILYPSSIEPIIKLVGPFTPILGSIMALAYAIPLFALWEKASEF